jgi:hypothetical protein
MFLYFSYLSIYIVYQKVVNSLFAGVAANAATEAGDLEVFELPSAGFSGC